MLPETDILIKHMYQGKMEAPSIPCKIYVPERQCWQSFKLCQFYLPNHERVFQYENQNSETQRVIKKEISHDYVVYFSKIIPTVLYNPLNRVSYQHQALNSDDLPPEALECMIVIEDLSAQHLPFVHHDQFIVLGFKVESMLYDEGNLHLIFLRSIISKLHFRLKYSREGLIYQVNSRLNKILYKTVKTALCFLTEMFHIHPAFSCQGKLKELQKMTNQSHFKEYMASILQSPIFKQELESMTYKTIIETGLFPVHVELNTMNEAEIWLAIKDLFSSNSNAPFGPNHHASICIGNFRYSFVFEPGNKERQKVSINQEHKRRFSYKNLTFKYQKLRIFDFFPADSWIIELASAAESIVKSYLEKTSSLILDPEDDGGSLKEYLSFLVETENSSESKIGSCRKIAREFYETYRVELDAENNNETFRRITKIMSEAEMRGYSNISNNCQTVVSDILKVFKKQFKKASEPITHDLFLSRRQSLIPKIAEEDTDNLSKDFLMFGSHFNEKCRSIGPLRLEHTLQYFDTYVDEDTAKIFQQENMKSLSSLIKKYLARKDVAHFISEFEKKMDEYDKIYKQGSQKSRLFQTKPNDSLIGEIKMDSGPNRNNIVSCLITIKFNELFNLRREIKIAKYCKSKLIKKEMIGKANSVLGTLLTNAKDRIRDANFKELADKIPHLYEKRTKLLKIYKELVFYYYNSVRVALKAKNSSEMSFFGFVIARNPEAQKIHQCNQERPNDLIIKKSEEEMHIENSEEKQRASSEQIKNEIITDVLNEVKIE